jgi:hypothetical protein
LVVSDSVSKETIDFAHSNFSLQRTIKKLSSNNNIDFHIIQNQLKNVIF